MNIIKKHLGLVVLSALLMLLSVYSGEVFFIILLIYVLFIKLLLSEYVSGALRKSLSIILWIGFVIVAGFIFYTNHYLPHGPSYPTGDIICLNDDRGPCGEQYKEDLRYIDIPNWAKFFKQSEGEALLLGLLFAALAVSGKDEVRKEV